MSVKLTEEQREAIEWAAGQAYSYAKPMTGESLMMKRWRALSELLAVQTTMAEPCDKCGLLDANKCAECNPGPTDHPDHSGDGSKKLDMSLEARLADAEADVARLHKDKMDLWMQLHGYAPVPQEGDERRDNFDVLIKQFATEYALDRTAAGGWIFENHNLFKFVYAALASKAAPALQDVPDTLLVDLFYAAQGDITKFRVKAREILGGTKVDPVRQDGDGRAAPDIAEFSELIDSYQCAQKDGNHDERAAARIALMSAYRAALASKAAAVAVEEPTVDLSKLQWLDTSIADPVEKARRVLKHLIEPDAVYFFEDGFPRCNTIASQAACVLAVLNAAVTSPAPIASSAEAAKSVATVRVTHKGYAMELSSHVAYVLSEGVHELYAHSAAAQPSRAEVLETPLFDDDDERDEFLQACSDFEDDGETAVDYQLLMKWADAGLLECEHFTITAAGNAEIERIERALKDKP
jgi:hypothetical protein